MNSKQTALIFGASSGIGFMVAKKLSEEGLCVYTAQRTPCSLDGVTSIETDVSHEGAVESAVNRVLEEKGGVDILVYSAGTSMAAPLEHAQMEDIRYLYEVNFFGALRATQCVLPKMRENKRGRIVLISSVGGALPIAFDSFYSSSKAALNMLAKTLEIELSPYNIFVTAVCPGGTSTRFTFKRKVYPDEQVGDYANAQNKAVISLANIEQGGMPASSVADTVIKVLNASSPSAVVGVGAVNKSFMLLDRLLPSKVTQAINKNQYKQ